VGTLVSWCLIFDGIVFVPPVPVIVTFFPETPASFTACQTVTNFELAVNSSPSGGLLSLSNANAGGTGGVFTLVAAGSVGTVSFSGASVSGTASVDITYTVGTESFTRTFVLNVTAPPPTTLSFSPAVGTFSACNAMALNVDITASQNDGVLTIDSFNTSATGGDFAFIDNTIDPTATLLYYGGITTGVASITLSYAPVCGETILTTYNVTVVAGPPPVLTFDPSSTPSYTAGSGTSINIIATGNPLEVLLVQVPLRGEQEVLLVPVAPNGSFTFSGATTAGIASVNVTYNLCGSSTTLTYQVNVVDATTLNFAPNTPQTVIACSTTPLTVSLISAPVGGTLVASNIATGGTVEPLTPPI
jgi:hypothetical protein